VTERSDPSVRTAAPDQTHAFTSPFEEKTHTPSIQVRQGADKGSKYVQGQWNNLPLYRCPLPESECQYATLDGDFAVEEHMRGAHPVASTDWMADAIGEPVEGTDA
jgi:hypothetical protein